MEKFIIGFIKKEFPILDETYHFFILGNALEDKAKNYNSYYLLFSLIDSNNKIRLCYIKPEFFEVITGRKIESIETLCDSFAGFEIILEIGDAVLEKELDLFLKGEEMKSVFLEGNSYKKIISFAIDQSEKKQKGIKFYEYIKKNKIPDFKMKLGNFNSIEGGYDIDAAFDGDPEAYWNID